MSSSIPFVWQRRQLNGDVLAVLDPDGDFRHDLEDGLACGF